jgi:hypothetical protein
MVMGNKGWVPQRITSIYKKIFCTVQIEIHSGNCRCREVFLLTENPAKASFVIVDLITGFNQHASSTACRVYVRTEFDTMQISGSCAIAGWQRGGNRLI